MTSSYLTNSDSFMYFTYRNVFCTKARVKRRTPMVRGEKLYEKQLITVSLLKG